MKTRVVRISSASCPFSSALALMLCFLVIAAAQAQEPSHYDATLQSLDQHHLPQWYADAKLGIFVHWGLYSVAVIVMTYSVAKDYLAHNVRCNCVSPAMVHTPFVDGYLKNNYPGREQEMFEKLSKAQPIGRMGRPDEVASLALFLCSDEASFITGVDYSLDGGFCNLRG